MMTFAKKIAGILLIGLSLSISVALAQQEHLEDSEQPIEKLFGKVLETGSFEFHLRSYFMATVNQGAVGDRGNPDSEKPTFFPERKPTASD